MIYACFFWGGDQVCRAMIDEDGPTTGILMEAKSTYTMHLTSSGVQMLFTKVRVLLGTGMYDASTYIHVTICIIHHKDAYHEC